MSRDWMRKLLLAPAMVALLMLSGLALAQEEPGDENEAPAAPSMSQGVDRAIEVITGNLDRQVAHLNDLLSTTPDAAHPGIERAIQAITEGLSDALDVLSARGGMDGPGDMPGDEPGGGEGDDGTGDLEASPQVEHSTSGVDRARRILLDLGSRSERGLGTAMDAAGRAGRHEISRALDQVHRGTLEALRALDRIDHPERVERPQRPTRPERVERPERPTRPERVERPERPTRPERPHPPARP